MDANKFNSLYATGAHFIYQSCGTVRGGIIVKTVSEARQLKNITVVEINREPYFTNINELTPVM